MFHFPYFSFLSHTHILSSLSLSLSLSLSATGPTDVTMVDFWRMVWQLHSPTIVMMTSLDEGRRKCEQYWPTFGTADYGPYSVTLAEQKIRANFIIRKLTLTVCTSFAIASVAELVCVCVCVCL